MNFHHDNGCGAQKAVRVDDVWWERVEGRKDLVKQTDWMVCDACGDLWPETQIFYPADEGLTFEDLGL